MIRRVPLAASLLAAMAATVQAHFLFIVPAVDGGSARVLLSETLEADGDVPVAIIRGVKLVVRGAGGADLPIELTEVRENAFVTQLPGDGSRVVHGVLDLGVNARFGSKPHVLRYYPKAIVGSPFDERTVLGGGRVVELVPVGEPGATRLKMLVNGQPAAKAALTVLLPNGDQEEVETDESGLTPAFDQRGRFGAWARYWEDLPGEIDGKKYEQLRHYATLVFDVPAEAQPVSTTKTAEATSAESTSDRFPRLPRAASSLGGAAANGWAYIYGGHVVRPHLYHTEAVTGDFHRLNLADPQAWEKLPGGTPLQGLNLVEADGKIYRIGGMHPVNQKGTPTDNRSVAECAMYDPERGAWTEFPALPKPRSSHDIVAAGNKLIVVGGWDMRGEEGEVWHDTMEILDLSEEKPTWKTEGQPFERRALIASVYQGKVYVIGGFQESSVPSLEVDIYDPQSGAWTKGPALPGKERNGFAPAACIHKGRLIASVADGSLLRLEDASGVWQTAGKTKPRIVHRLISFEDQILLIGGASFGGNVDVVESVTLR